MKKISIGDNWGLEKVNTSELKKLEKMELNATDIISLDISGNSRLKYLTCPMTLKELNMTGIINVKKILCYKNKFVLKDCFQLKKIILDKNTCKEDISYLEKQLKKEKIEAEIVLEEESSKKGPVTRGQAEIVDSKMKQEKAKTRGLCIILIIAGMGVALFFIKKSKERKCLD